MNIRSKLLLAFFSVTFISIVLLSLIATNNATRTINHEVENALNTLVDEKVGLIYRYLNEKERVVAAMAELPTVTHGLENLSAVISLGRDSLIYLAEDGNVRQILTQLKLRYDLYDLFLISPNGDIIFTVKHEDDFATNLNTGLYSETQLARAFDRAATLLESSVTRFEPYSPSLKYGQIHSAFIAAPVIKEDKLLGVLAIQLNGDDYYPLATNYTGIKRTGEVVIGKLEDNHAVIIAPLRRNHQAAFNLRIPIGSEVARPIQLGVLGERGSGLSIDYDGLEILAAWRYIPELQWGVVVKIEAVEAFAAAEQLRMRFLLSGIGALIFGALVALYFSSKLSAPIVALIKASEGIMSGEYDQFIAVDTSDEVGRLGYTFNSMAAQLKRYIGEQVLTEEKLRYLRDYLANIIDSMPSVLIGIEQDGKVTQWNTEAEQATGVSKKHAVGQPLLQVFPRLSMEMPRVNEAIEARTKMSDLKRPYKQDGETRYEDVTIYPLISNGVEGAVIRLDNVTEQVRLEEMMIQSEKMLSVGGLAAGMAHEINNPLAGMMQTSNVMKNRLTTINMPANIRVAEEVGISLEAMQEFMEARGILRMVDDIKTSGQRVAEIVDNMLSFARKSDSAFSSRDLAELMDKTLSLAATDYDLKKQYDFKAIKIVRQYEDKLPLVSCEASKIQQVFLNILRNGAQAMQQAKISSPAFILRTRYEADREMVCVEVEDNGPGIDIATRKRVFEPFFTTKSVGEGTGLGLSVSYFIITENHGGDMSVESEPCKGARFIIGLPLSNAVRNTK